MVINQRAFLIYTIDLRGERANLLVEQRENTRKLDWLEWIRLITVAWGQTNDGCEILPILVIVVII